MSKLNVSSAVNALIGGLIVALILLFVFNGRNQILNRAAQNVFSRSNESTRVDGANASSTVFDKGGEDSPSTTDASCVAPALVSASVEVRLSDEIEEPVFIDDVSLNDEFFIAPSSEAIEMTSARMKIASNEDFCVAPTSDESEIVFDEETFAAADSETFVPTSDESEIVFDEEMIAAPDFEAFAPTSDESEIVFGEETIAAADSEAFAPTSDEPEIVFDEETFAAPALDEKKDLGENDTFDNPESAAQDVSLEILSDEAIVADNEETKLEITVEDEETLNDESVAKTDDAILYDSKESFESDEVRSSDTNSSSVDSELNSSESFELFGENVVATKISDATSEETTEALEPSNADDAETVAVAVGVKTPVAETEAGNAPSEIAVDCEKTFAPCGPVERTDDEESSTNFNPDADSNGAEKKTSTGTKDELANEFWIAGSNGNDFYFWFFDGKVWQTKTNDDFFNADNPARSTIIWAHGYQTDMADAANDAFVFRAVLDAAQAQAPTKRAYRLVVWKWASERSAQRLRKDARSKAILADFEGRNLAAFAARLNPKTDVAFVGFSFGARVVGSALQALATNRGEYIGRFGQTPDSDGFAVSGANFESETLGDVLKSSAFAEAPSATRYSDSFIERGRTSLILINAGCDWNAFGRGGAYSDGAALATDVLNAYNPNDFVLKFYPLASETKSQALGVAPIGANWFPNVESAPTNVDVWPAVGKRHSFADSIQSVPRELWIRTAL